MRYLLFLPVLLLMNCTGQISKQKSTFSENYITAQGSAFHLAISPAEQELPEKLIYGTYQGHIVSQGLEDGRIIFDYDAGAYPFSIKAVDLNGNGEMEVLAALASGELIALNEKGALLWRFQSRMPLFAVDAGNIIEGGDLEIVTGGLDRKVYLLDAKGNLLSTSKEMQRLVHRIAVGKLEEPPPSTRAQGAKEVGSTADKIRNEMPEMIAGTDQVLVIENRNTANLLAYKDKKLSSVWRRQLSVPQSFVNWENPGGEFFAFDLKINDLDGDGVNEIILGDSYFNQQSIAVLNNKAEMLWISEGEKPFQFEDGDPDRLTELYSTAFVETAEIMPQHPGKEIITLAGGLLKVYSAQGELLKKAHSKLGYTDLLMVGSTAYLGSSPNGDNTIYRVDLAQGNTENFYHLERQGRALEIGHTLEKTLAQVKNIQTPAEVLDKKVRFTVNSSDYQQETKFLQQRFPYSNISYITRMKVMENEPPTDENGEPWSISRWKVDAIKGTNSVEEILEKARYIEENKIPTLFHIGHSNMPFISLATAEKILQTAPEYCLGFATAEDEDLDRLPSYFTHFYGPLSELCLAYGNKLNVTKNKGIWWISSPAMPEVYKEMFEGERRLVNAVSTEDSNSRTPEMNLFGRSGLWLAGLTDHMVVNLNADLFSFNRYFQLEYPKHGHPFLRRMISHTLMGGSMFNIRFRDKMQTAEGYEYNQMGRESSEIFYHLLGKGLVFTPEREQVRGFSSLGFIVHQPKEKWLIDAHNGHAPELWEDDAELHNAILPHNGVPWGMTPTPDHALQKILFHKDRQFGYHIPATPYGLVAFIPAQADQNKVPGVNRWWHTDGIYIWKEGEKKMTGQEAATALKDSFEAASQELLFNYQGDDIFMQVLHLDENEYRLYMIDPGWLDPQERKTRILSQFGSIASAQDVLENKALKVIDQNAFDLSIPAGAFKIIDVKISL